MRHGLSLVLGGLLLACVAGTARAEMCQRCERLPATGSIGRCKECDQAIVSESYQLCRNCSKDIAQCERCRIDLTELAPTTRPAIDLGGDNIYKSGRWEYRVAISGAGTRSQGVRGTLLFDGAILPQPEHVNEFYRTPFGEIYWIGDPSVPFGAHGWNPNLLPRQAMGGQLPHPAGVAHTLVQVQVISDGALASNDADVTDNWLIQELKKLAVKQPRAQQPWFALTRTPVSIHDTKLYGRALLSVVPSHGDQPLCVAVTGSQKQRIQVPRQHGATRLVKYTLASPLDSLDLYLAIRVDITFNKTATSTRPSLQNLNTLID